jgi:hypothetical protein
MTSTLETTVGAVLDRLVEMERLAVPDAVNAVKHWYHWEPGAPYWTNQITGLTTPGDHRWELKVSMYLIVGHASQAVAGGALSIQDMACRYIPATLAYFVQYNQLNPPGLSDVLNLAPAGVRMACPQGLDALNLPGQTATFLCVEFELTVPLLIYEEF